MAAPLLQAQIDINAPVSKVWELVSDLRKMPQWSPQCRRMIPLGGPPRQGSRTININRRNMLFWPTTSRITEFVPEKKLAFRVNENGSVWTFELEPTDTGTRLMQARHAEHGVKPISTKLVNAFMGGVESFEHELVDGMNQTLARIKAAAEN
ncbi:SRPBCC family protein [Mycolicibacterium sp. XJ662]